MSPISSSKSVPPFAALTLPSMSRVAAENAPFLAPKSSLSIRLSGMAAQFTATNGPSRAGCCCELGATALLPVPVFAREEHAHVEARHESISWKSSASAMLRPSRPWSFIRRRYGAVGVRLGARLFLEANARDWREPPREVLDAQRFLVGERVRLGLTLQVEHADRGIAADRRAKHRLDLASLHALAIAKPRIEEGGLRAHHGAGRHGVGDDAARDERADPLDFVPEKPGRVVPGRVVAVGAEELEVALLRPDRPHDERERAGEKRLPIRLRIQIEQPQVEVSLLRDARKLDRPEGWPSSRHYGHKSVMRSLRRAPGSTVGSHCDAAGRVQRGFGARSVSRR